MSGDTTSDQGDDIEFTEMDTVRGALLCAMCNGLTLDDVLAAACFDAVNTAEDFDASIEAAVQIRGALGK